MEFSIPYTDCIHIFDKSLLKIGKNIILNRLPICTQIDQIWLAELEPKFFQNQDQAIIYIQSLVKHQPLKPQIR